MTTIYPNQDIIIFGKFWKFRIFLVGFATGSGFLHAMGA